MYCEVHDRIRLRSLENWAHKPAGRLLEHDRKRKIQSLQGLDMRKLYLSACYESDDLRHWYVPQPVFVASTILGIWLVID